MIDINGSWIGFYTYGSGYSELDRLQSVPFNATIEQGFNRFVGRITEEEEYGGIVDEIAIRGNLSGDEIEFAKYYTLEHRIDNNDEIVSIKSDNPTIVYYKGRYLDENKFKGQWEITGFREDDEGVFHADNQSGDWEMWRE